MYGLLAYMYVCIHVCAWCPWRPEATDALELGLQMVLNHTIWTLDGAESSARVASILNHPVSSATLKFPLVLLFLSVYLLCVCARLDCHSTCVKSTEDQRPLCGTGSLVHLCVDFRDWVQATTFPRQTSAFAETSCCPWLFWHLNFYFVVLEIEPGSLCTLPLNYSQTSFLMIRKLTAHDSLLNEYSNAIYLFANWLTVWA